MAHRHTPLAVVLLCGACTTTLPAEQGAALGKLAEADAASLEAAAVAVRDAARERAAHALGSDQAVLRYSDGCKEPNLLNEKVAACQPEFTYMGLRQSLTLQAPESRKLLARIAAYGKAMAELSEAKDVVEAQKKVDAATTSLAAVVALIPGAAAATPAITAASQWRKYDLASSRRKLLLEAAQEAQQVLIPAVMHLNGIARELQRQLALNPLPQLASNLETIDEASAAQRLVEQELGPRPDKIGYPAAAATQFSELGSIRRIAAREFFQATDRIALARKLNVRFESLADANAKLIANLKQPSRKPADVGKDVDAFLDLLSDIKTAAQ